MEDRNYLSQKSYELMTTTKALKSKQGSFGLGFMVYSFQGHKLVGHSGGPALADVAKFEDDGLTVIALANQRGFYPYLTVQLHHFTSKDKKPKAPDQL